MVTGSYASAYYGEPRATLDLDIVIEPSTDQLDVFVEDVVLDGYYIDRDAAFEALRQQTQFNVVAAEAFKIDFIIRKDRPFSREEFGRRRPAVMLDTPVFVATVEDMILAKLEWSVPFDSERQLRDVAAMVQVAGGSLDRAYIDRWAETLGVGEAWRRQ